MKRHRCFPVRFAKFLRAPFLQNTSGRLLLPNIIITLTSVLKFMLFRSCAEYTESKDLDEWTCNVQVTVCTVYSTQFAVN